MKIRCEHIFEVPAVLLSRECGFFLFGATDFVVQVRYVVSKVLWECQGPKIAKTTLKKKNLKHSHYPISKLDRKLQDPKVVALGKH